MPAPARAFLQRNGVDIACLRSSGQWLLVGLWWLVLLLCVFTGYGDTSGGGADAFQFVGGGICRDEVETQLTDMPFAHPSLDVCPNFRRRTSCSVQIEPREELQDHVTSTKEQGEAEKMGDRVLRDKPPKLNEFKHKAVNPKGKSLPGQSVGITHRVEPGGTEYNYASDSKGAKIMAYNKEAKGASNILGKDMDKYLRNPCSAEGKFVIIELSEETLVCTVEIANYEHYSSSLKEFEVLGSLVYPTENWVKLGHFTGKNVKQPQRFRLEEPKWVRYLKLDLLTHYGSEFYCTLSTVKVYGVDAVEQMLEDLISVQDHVLLSEEGVEERKSALPQPMPSQTDGPEDQDRVPEDNSGSASEDSKQKDESHQGNSGDQIRDVQPQPVGRVAGESVLKILMQKVRSLDTNLSILERYLEELNKRYGNLFKELDEEVAQKSVLLEKTRLELMDLLDNKETTARAVSDFASWKSLASSQIDTLVKENEILRLQVKKAVDFQADMENKNIVVLLLAFVFASCSAVKLVADFTVNTLTRKHVFSESCKSKIPWMFLSLYCVTVAFILLL